MLVYFLLFNSLMWGLAVIKIGRRRGRIRLHFCPKGRNRGFAPSRGKTGAPDWAATTQVACSLWAYGPYSASNRIRFSAEKPRRLQVSTGHLLRAAFRILCPPPPNKKTSHKGWFFVWWGRTDSNHRSDTQQIYSLSPLATRELPRMCNFCLHKQNSCIIP